MGRYATRRDASSLTPDPDGPRHEDGDEAEGEDLKGEEGGGRGRGVALGRLLM